MTSRDYTNFDPADAHFRYEWVAHLDDASCVEQFDATGRPRSVRVLDWEHVTTMQLRPVWQNIPAVEARARLAKGERLRKFWQVDRLYQDGVEQSVLVREVLCLAQLDDAGDATRCFLLLDEDGGALLAAKQDVAPRMPVEGPVGIRPGPDAALISRATDTHTTVGWVHRGVHFVCHRDTSTGALTFEIEDA